MSNVLYNTLRILLIIFLIIFISTVIYLVSETKNVLHTTLNDLTKAKTECELSLPTGEKCVLIFVPEYTISKE